jgi:hypothetical protein
MRTSVIIVDDFLNNANALRQAALQLDYPASRRCISGKELATADQPGCVVEQVSSIVGEPLAPSPPPQSHAKSRMTLG